MQGIPAALYARWAPGSEFQNFPPELSRVGRNGSSPQNYSYSYQPARCRQCRESTRTMWRCICQVSASSCHARSVCARYVMVLTGTLNRQVHFERLVRLSLDVSFELPNDSIDL